MIAFIFNKVANTLWKLSDITGYTYNQINVIVYFFIIPISWAALIDLIFKFQHFKIASFIFYFGFYVGCNDFRNYSDLLFNKSVIFLNYFNKIGSNYYKSSVWICVALPIIIYLFLLNDFIIN